MEPYFEKVQIVKNTCESIKGLLGGKIDRRLSEAINNEISKTLSDFGAAGLGKINFFFFTKSYIFVDFYKFSFFPIFPIN